MGEFKKWMRNMGESSVGLAEKKGLIFGDVYVVPRDDDKASPIGLAFAMDNNQVVSFDLPFKKIYSAFRKEDLYPTDDFATKLVAKTYVKTCKQFLNGKIKYVPEKTENDHVSDAEKELKKRFVKNLKKSLEKYQEKMQQNEHEEEYEIE